MHIAEIKAAVDAGETVHWSNAGYVVIKDSLGQYLIRFKPNGHCIGLTNQAGDTLNGQPEDFFLSDPTARPAADAPSLEEITVTVQMIYGCPMSASLTDQSDMIHADLCRLLDYDSTIEADCAGFTIRQIAPEAETYGNIESANVPSIQADRMSGALSALYIDAQSPGELLRNALCDLRHFADANGLDFALWNRSAAAWHAAEQSWENGEDSRATSNVTAS